MKPSHPALLLLALPALATGQQRPAPFLIADNSFLVEEAFNQPEGIFQNIFLFSRGRGSSGWGLEFTQEWPVGGPRHQFSYTIPVDRGFDGFGNVMVNWRLQARMEDAGGPAFSPRLSAILPTGEDESFQYGAQVNLPLSKQMGDLYVHGNAGATWERFDIVFRNQAGQQIGEESVSLLSPWVGGSLIWRMLPMVHPMVETIASFDEVVTGIDEKSRETSWLLSPGVRAAKNLGTHQLVLGLAAPLRLSGSDPEASFLIYFSYELPFR